MKKITLTEKSNLFDKMVSRIGYAQTAMNTPKIIEIVNDMATLARSRTHGEVTRKEYQQQVYNTFKTIEAKYK